MAANFDLNAKHIVRIRGIPWSCSREEIKKFFSDCDVKNGLEGIHFALSGDGKPSGEAYIELQSLEDLDIAKKKNLQYIGSRYIEVFEASESEMGHFLNGLNGCAPNGPPNSKRRKLGGGPKNGGGVQFGGTMPMFEEQPFDELFVRLRGLPFNCKFKDLQKFFEGIEIAPNGIKMPLDRQNKSLGEAYIQFATISDADKAMSKHKEKIGYRYIEVFRSSAKEFHSVFVEGQMPYPMQFNPRFPPPHNPWMDGYGPRGPPHGLDYPPPPRSPGSFYRNQWGPANGPPRYPYGGYGPPPLYGRDPFYENYIPSWSQQHQHDFNGPNKSHPMHRPLPYERPPDKYSDNNSAAKNEDSSEVKTLPPAPPSQSSNHFVFVHGLPSNVRESDLMDFFNSSAANVKPTFIKLIRDDFGWANEAKVEFSSHEDAVKAMQKDKAVLYDRSVDLFLCSKEPPKVQPSNGSHEKKDCDIRPPPPPQSSSEPSTEVFGANYSYVSPSNNSTPNAATVPPPPPVGPAPSEEKSYSFYGMVPSGWRPEFTIPTSQSAQAAAYPYGYANPYYAYGPQAAGYGYGYGYGNYASTGASLPGSEHTIRKEPINYASR